MRSAEPRGGAKTTDRTESTTTRFEETRAALSRFAPLGPSKHGDGDLDHDEGPKETDEVNEAHHLEDRRPLVHLDQILVDFGKRRTTTPARANNDSPAPNTIDRLVVSKEPRMAKSASRSVGPHPYSPSGACDSSGQLVTRTRTAVPSGDSGDLIRTSGSLITETGIGEGPAVGDGEGDDTGSTK